MTEVEFNNELAKLADRMIKNETVADNSTCGKVKIVSRKDYILTLLKENGNQFKTNLYFKKDGQTTIFFDIYKIDDKYINKEYKRIKDIFTNSIQPTQPQTPRTLVTENIPIHNFPDREYLRQDFIEYMESLHRNPKGGKTGEYKKNTIYTYTTIIFDTTFRKYDFSYLVANIDNLIRSYKDGKNKDTNQKGNNAKSSSLEMLKRYIQHKGYNKSV